MKKNLFLMLSLWISGASIGSAQPAGYYPAPAYYPQAYPQGYPGAARFAQPAQPTGHFPGYMGPVVQRSYGLEPYPDQMPRPGVASVNPRPAAPALAPVGGVVPASAVSATPTFPNWSPPSPPGRGASDGNGILSPSTDLPTLPGAAKGDGFLPPPPTETPPGRGASEGDGFLPPPPMGVDPAPADLPESVPPPLEKLDMPPQKVVPPTDASCPAGDCGPVYAVMSPGQPIMAQFIDGYTLTRGRNWFFSADYLHWWVKDQTDVPGLTAPVNGAQAGVTSDPDNGERTGVRGHLGRWMGEKWALEGDFLLLFDRNQSSSISTGPTAAVQLPFFSGIDGMSRTTTAPTHFWQVELGTRYKVLAKPCWHVDLLAGARYLELDEGMIIRSSTAFTQAPVLLSSAVVTTIDDFSADNRFIGANVGLDAEYEHNWFFLQGNLKLGVGNNRQRVSINGSTIVQAPPQPLGNQTIAGTGTFATPSNSGVYARNRLTLIPEAAVYSGVKFGNCVRLGVGYNFLFITDVVRPADQIDPTTAQTLPLSFLGPPFVSGQPTFPFASSTFWAQGVSVRLEIRY